jgi:hypothetical protein
MYGCYLQTLVHSLSTDPRWQIRRGSYAGTILQQHSKYHIHPQQDLLMVPHRSFRCTQWVRSHLELYRPRYGACLFDYFIIASSSFIIHFIRNYSSRQSVNIPYVKLTIFYRCVSSLHFVHSSVYSSLTVLHVGEWAYVFTCACAYAFMHKCRSLLLVLSSYIRSISIYVSIFFLWVSNVNIFWGPSTAPFYIMFF